MLSPLTTTLTRADYCSPEVFDLERRRLFHRGWLAVALSCTIDRGSRRVFDIAGESVLVTRDLAGSIHAHANVCRHRGARLCEVDTDSTQGSLMCPYHAWTYALDGRLIATPHLSDDDLDKSELSLWSIAVTEWHGLVFVCLALDPPPFAHWIEVHGAQAAALRRFGIADLRVAVTTTAEVAANWKIIVENYQECLHCTRVHPELVDRIPLYRTGWVVDRDRTDGGVSLRDGMTGYSDRDADPLPVLPGLSDLEATSYFGATLFPNVFIDVTGNNVVITVLAPKSPTSTISTAYYLFAPETITAPGFDPSGVVAFNERLGGQDNLVCEGVQRGVSSTAFAGGVLTAKDFLVVAFNDHYRSAMGASAR